MGGITNGGRAWPRVPCRLVGIRPAALVVAGLVSCTVSCGSAVEGAALGGGQRSVVAGPDAGLPATPGPDELILELGGPDDPRLADVLIERGIRPAPQRGSVSQEAGPKGSMIPGPSPSPRVLPVDGPGSDGAPRVVELQPGGSLSRLCEAALGTSRVWREVAEFNGWSEEELKRLPAGTKVELPPALDPQRGGSPDQDR